MAPFVSVNLSARQFTADDLVDDVTAILARDGPGAGRARARDHRERGDGPVRDGHPRPGRAARPGRTPRARRLRDRLLVPGLSQAPAARHHQDRPVPSSPGSTRSPTARSCDAVIALAHGLGIGVVAEGIETARQAERLRELGCDLGQGYLFSRPVPAAATARLLAMPSSDGAALRRLRGRAARAGGPGTQRPPAPAEGRRSSWGADASS